MNSNPEVHSKGEEEKKKTKQKNREDSCFVWLHDHFYSVYSGCFKWNWEIKVALAAVWSGLESSEHCLLFFCFFLLDVAGFGIAEPVGMLWGASAKARECKIAKNILPCSWPNFQEISIFTLLKKGQHSHLMLLSVLTSAKLDSSMENTLFGHKTFCQHILFRLLVYLKHIFNLWRNTQNQSQGKKEKKEQKCGKSQKRSKIGKEGLF